MNATGCAFAATLGGGGLVTPGWRGSLIVGLLGVALVLVAVALGG